MVRCMIVDAKTYEQCPNEISEGSELAACPECAKGFPPGYPKQMDFGVMVGMVVPNPEAEAHLRKSQEEAEKRNS